jgi:hypothetical protein
MDPFTREIMIAQHQDDLRGQAEQRRRAQRLRRPGAMRLGAGHILLALARALMRSAERARQRKYGQLELTNPVQRLGLVGASNGLARCPAERGSLRLVPCRPERRTRPLGAHALSCRCDGR